MPQTQKYKKSVVVPGDHHYAKDHFVIYIYEGQGQINLEREFLYGDGPFIAHPSTNDQGEGDG